MRLVRPLVAATAATLAIATHPMTASAVTSLTEGHVDVIDVSLSGSSLQVHTHDHESGTEFNPADIRLVVTPAARTTVPTGAQWAFLGNPGDPVWILPQIQKAGVLFAGYSTEEIGSGVLQGNSLSITLTNVTGPNGVSLYSVGTFGTITKLADSEDGLPDTIAATANQHRHFNWAFEAAGTYTLTFRVTARLANGTPVDSGPVTFTFPVNATS
jgi:surface-anchored protein